MTGVEEIAYERGEQIKKHGYDHAHDKEHETKHSLLMAANGTLMAEFGEFPSHWDDHDVNNIIQKPLRERMIIAGALIAAAIDRYDAED